MSKEDSLQDEAFSLLTKVCKVKPEKLLNAFGVANSYYVYPKKGKEGKERIIQEPKEPLMSIQKDLLSFLYRLKYRTDNYNSSYDGYERKKSVTYKKVLDHLISPKINGQLPGKSLQSALKAHLKTNALFLIKMDLREAYPSVKTKVLEKILFEIFLDECKAYYFAYQNALEVKKEKQSLKGFIKNVDGIAQMVAIEVEETYGKNLGYFDWQTKAQKILKEMGFDVSHPYETLFENDHYFRRRTEKSVHNYPNAPLFPKHSFPEFRKMIRDLVVAGIEIEQSDVFEIF